MPSSGMTSSAGRVTDRRGAMRSTQRASRRGAPFRAPTPNRTHLIKNLATTPAWSEGHHGGSVRGSLVSNTSTLTGRKPHPLKRTRSMRQTNGTTGSARRASCPQVQQPQIKRPAQRLHDGGPPARRAVVDEVARRKQFVMPGARGWVRRACRGAPGDHRQDSDHKHEGRPDAQVIGAKRISDPPRTSFHHTPCLGPDPELRHAMLGE